MNVHRKGARGKFKDKGLPSFITFDKLDVLHPSGRNKQADPIVVSGGVVRMQQIIMFIL